MPFQLAQPTTESVALFLSASCAPPAAALLPSPGPVLQKQVLPAHHTPYDIIEKRD